MADSLVKYKRYGREELQEAFFREPVYYSRSSLFRGRCPGLPDFILVSVAQEQSGWAGELRIIVRAEIQNQSDYVSKELKRQDYVYGATASSAVWVKSALITSNSGERPLGLLSKIVSALDDLVTRLPFHMYESQNSKRLRDYVNFMTSCQAKLRYADVVRRFGGREDTLAQVAREVSNSRYVRRSLFFPTGEKCRIAHLPDNRWCAWVAGDDYIPVFPNEKVAVRFLENRSILYAI